MDEHHNRGSPRLQFTKEELENDALSRPTAMATEENTYDVAKKKLKKRNQGKLAMKGRKVNPTGVNAPKDSVSGSSSAILEHNPDNGFTEAAAQEAQGIRTDPRAPAVRNTRQRPAPAKAAAAKDDLVSDSLENSLSQQLDKPASSASASSSPQTKKALHLKFEETQVKKPSRLTHSVQKTIRTAGDQLHRQAVKANEDDNVAVDAVLQADTTKESVLQMGNHAYHAHKMRAHKKVELAEKRLDKANIRQLEKQAQQEHPVFTSNPYSRWQQKKAIRREYAAAKYGKGGKRVQKTAKNAEKAAEKTTDAAEKVVNTVRKHPSILLILGLGALLLVVMSSLQSCSLLLVSTGNSVGTGTYPADEADIQAAEQAYLAKERQLKDEMDHYEQYHPGYDEYHVDAAEIWHDPYVLISIISACKDGEDWDINSATPIIDRYFKLQYEVTETISTETRYRTENGKSVPYTYTICNVKLVNKNLSHLPAVSMSHQALSMYAMYMSTHGNMEGIFTGPHATPLQDPMLYDIPQETLDADPTFSKLMEEATQYIGYPYVWGGSDPETSFDCSGFISYVFTHSGVYNTGRLGAKGLRSLCRNVSADQLKPGDIVFFDGTMGAGVEGVTHCGIYVGNNMMIHCGSPIGYANLNDSYWRQHFHSYGRIPY